MNSYKHPKPEEIYENITNTYLNSCEKRAEFDKLPVKPFNIPPKLYQYRCFDEDGHNINNLKNSKIWCSTVKNFNDLHEGTLKMPSDEDIIKGTNLEVRKFKNDLHRKPKEYKTKIISEIKSSTNAVAKNIFAVSCFTINNSCLPMWAHYADIHKGFCLEFNLSPKLDEFPWLYPVAYSNEKINYDDNRIDKNNCTPEKDCSKCEREAFTKCFVTKAKDWSYEQEWRILNESPTYGKVDNYLETDFPGVTQDVSGCITGIYLGALIEPENEAEMIALAKEKGLPIYKKEASHDSFELQDTLLWSPKSTMRN